MSLKRQAIWSAGKPAGQKVASAHDFNSFLTAAVNVGSTRAGKDNRQGQRDENCFDSFLKQCAPRSTGAHDFNLFLKQQEDGEAEEESGYREVINEEKAPENDQVI